MLSHHFLRRESNKSIPVTLQVRDGMESQQQQGSTILASTWGLTQWYKLEKTIRGCFCPISYYDFSVRDGNFIQQLHPSSLLEKWYPVTNNIKGRPSIDTHIKELLIENKDCNNKSWGCPQIYSWQNVRYLDHYLNSGQSWRKKT